MNGAGRGMNAKKKKKNLQLVLLCRTLCPVTKCDIKYVDVQVVCQYYYAVL
jgi:hypothetical protein